MNKATPPVDILGDLRAFVHREFTEGLEDADLEDDENFVAAGIVDSYGLIEIISYVELTYAIQLTDDDLISPELTSICGLAGLVEERQK